MQDVLAIRIWLWVFDRKRATVCRAVMLVAALFFFAHVAPDAVPGLSAQRVAEHSGADVLAPLSHPIWGWTGHLMAKLLPGPIAWPWNLLSALAGTAVCGLVVVLAGTLVGNPRDRWIIHRHHRAFQNMAGTVAALLLAFSSPFRVVAAMAHPLTFDLALLLGAFWLLLRYAETKHKPILHASALVLGLAVTDYATALLAVPLHGVIVLFLLARHQRLKSRLLLTVPVLFLAGGTPFLLMAAGLARQAAATGLELHGFNDALWLMLREYYLALRFSVPKVGFILIGLFAIAPLIAVLSFPQETKWSARLLLFVLAGLSALMFLDGPLTPWSLSGFQGLLVMPYVLAAMWSGCLAAYVLGHILAAPSFASRKSTSRARLNLAVAAGLLLLAAAVIGAASAPGRKLDVRVAMPITRFAEAVAAQLTDGQWIILEDVLEPLVRLKAAERGVSPFFISATRYSQRTYQRALAVALANERLASVGELGLIPLLRERLDPVHGPAPVISTIGDGPLLRFVAASAWPDRALYSIPAPGDLDLDRYAREALSCWAGFSPPDRTSAGPFSLNLTRLLAGLARTANDTGVWLEDQQRPDLARAAYREAIRLNPDTISARLNLRESLGTQDPEAGQLTDAIDPLAARLHGKISLAQLTDLHGFIRHEAAYRAAKARWNRTDPADDLDVRFQQIMNLADDDEAFGRIMSMSDPGPTTSADALRLGFARIAAGYGRAALARRLLETIPADGPLARVRLIEIANLDVQAGRKEQAYQALKAIPKSEVDDPRALILLALLTAESRPDDCDRYLDRLESFPDRLGALSLPMARIYLLRGNEATAARHLEQFIQREPLNKVAIRLLLRIRMSQQRLDLAAPLIRQLLALDNRDPLANLALSQRLAAEGREVAASAARELARAEDGASEGLSPEKKTDIRN